MLSLLLRQLGHADAQPGAATRAWLAGVREWRAKRADNEARVAALRLYAETGSLEEVLPARSECRPGCATAHHPRLLGRSLQAPGCAAELLRLRLIEVRPCGPIKVADSAANTPRRSPS